MSHDGVRASRPRGPSSLRALAAPAQAADAASTSLDLDTLYRAHAPTVARWVSRLAGPGYDVEDLVHEVFLAAEALLANFRGEAKVTTWLYAITENVVRHQRRKQRWRRWLGIDTPSLERIEDVAPGPAEALERRRSDELVYRVLDGLPEKYRTVLILFEIEGLAGEDIAELTGTKLATVWTWLFRGRKKFLERLSKIAPEEVERRLAAGQRSPGADPPKGGRP